LQRVEPIALGHRRLLVAKDPDLAGGVDAEADDHQHRDAEPHRQPGEG
jgi:hypothetical protein